MIDMQCVLRRCCQGSIKLLGFIFFSLILLSWSMPVQANTNTYEVENINLIKPKLEAEVLQIIRNHPEIIKEALQAEQLQQQKKQQETLQLIKQEIKQDPNSVIGESPVIGATEKKIVLIEFSDFQCPFCAKAHKTLKQFMAKHQNEVTLVYKHFPLSSIHPEAIQAAKAAGAANKQGKFWQYQDVLFAKQNKLGERLYINTAKKLNLDLSQFNEQRNSEEVNAEIEKDKLLARNLGIRGTPFFFINGETFSGAVPLSKIESVLSTIKANSGT